ncbi:hypothetical protein PIB30_086155, partial [Stylosanthes scabra]|nr:hypothetical protein [Stylosanthes scabra]
MVHNEVTQKEEKEEEEKEEDDNWLYELLAELANSDDEDDDEEAEEESEEEADKDDIKGETEGETFFIATVFNKNEEAKTEIPVKCEDPGPCLVTCKIRGVDVRECLCDPGTCGNVMPYALYDTLDLSDARISQTLDLGEYTESYQ